MHFVRAVTLGYDIGPRVTMSFGALDFRNNSHKSTHAIAGVFGAAAAAGCAADLNAQQMRWMLDYTAQQSFTGTPPSPGVPSAGTSVPNPIQACPPSTPCLTSICDPNLQGTGADTGRMGLCTTVQKPRCR